MFKKIGPGRRSRWRTPLVAAAVVAVLVGGASAFGDPAETAPVAVETPTGDSGTEGVATPDATTPPPSPSAAPSVASSPTPTLPSEPVAAAGTALAAVADLEVKGRAPKTGYDRDLFAYRAYDQDRNGCDIRNDILRRDLADLVTGVGTNGCVVETGTLHDPYSGTPIAFTRGSSTSGQVQIDHVVALSDAWQKGAQSWDVATMREFGNDPLNLLAADGPLNAQKGDGDAATWLPPNKVFRCGYVARQVAVKREYDLWVTEAEREAMVRVLGDCPAQALPARETAPLMPELAAPAPAAPAPAVEAPAPAPDAAGAQDPRFDSCKDAKAAGYGPYVSGVDPEYGWYRDGDSDGTVCEG